MATKDGQGGDPDHPDQAKLPPGFIVVPSASRPGQVSYLDTKTNKKYMTLQQTWEIYNEGQGKGKAADPKAAGFKLGPQQVRTSANKQVGTAPSQEQLKHIQQVLSNAEATTKAGMTWFKRYNTGASGSGAGSNTGALTMEELKRLLDDLNTEVGLPPLNDDRLLEALFRKFDTNKNGLMEFTEFLNLYAAILRRVRDRYIKAGLRRDFFIDKNKSGKPEDFYRTLSKLGEGSFGLVYRVEDNATKEERVLKVINKAKSAMPPEELQLEIDTLKALDHPHIIKLFEYFEDYNNIYIIMESAKGGELLDVINSNYKAGYRLNEQWIGVVYEQVIGAISYVHARGIMHKDIKAENIMLLDDGHSATHPHAVIIDLGLAEMFDKQKGRSTNIAGTPVTMAPEVWNQCFGPKCDVWSLGVVLFQLLSGKLPFIAKTCKKRDWLEVLSQPPNWKRLDHCSPGARTLCVDMLQYDEAKRPTAQECLAYPWFKEAPHLQDVNLSAEVMNDLCNYHERTDLEKLVASQLSATKLPNLNLIFHKYDKNNNGTLSMDELASALEELGVDPSTCARAAEALDVDQSGEVEYTEFVAGCLNFFDDQLDTMLWQFVIHLRCIPQAFTKFDHDGSGTLSVDEISQLLCKGQELGLGTLAPDQSQVKAMISKLDKNSDGMIDFDEFRRFFTPQLDQGGSGGGSGDPASAPSAPQGAKITDTAA